MEPSSSSLAGAFLDPSPAQTMPTPISFQVQTSALSPLQNSTPSVASSSAPLPNPTAPKKKKKKKIDPAVLSKVLNADLASQKQAANPPPAAPAKRMPEVIDLTGLDDDDPVPNPPVIKSLHSWDGEVEEVKPTKESLERSLHESHTAPTTETAQAQELQPTFSDSSVQGMIPLPRAEEGQPRQVTSVPPIESTTPSDELLSKVDIISPSPKEEVQKEVTPVLLSEPYHRIRSDGGAITAASRIVSEPEAAPGINLVPIPRTGEGESKEDIEMDEAQPEEEEDQTEVQDILMQDIVEQQPIIVSILIILSASPPQHSSSRPNQIFRLLNLNPRYVMSL